MPSRFDTPDNRPGAVNTPAATPAPVGASRFSPAMPSAVPPPPPTPPGYQAPAVAPAPPAPPAYNPAAQYAPKAPTSYMSNPGVSSGTAAHLNQANQSQDMIYQTAVDNWRLNGSVGPMPVRPKPVDVVPGFNDGYTPLPQFTQQMQNWSQSGAGYNPVITGQGGGQGGQMGAASGGSSNSLLALLALMMGGAGGQQKEPTPFFNNNRSLFYPNTGGEPTGAAAPPAGQTATQTGGGSNGLLALLTLLMGGK